MKESLFTVFALVILETACVSQGPAPEGQPMDVTSPQTTSAGALKFTAPAGWIQETPSSRMRVEQYRLPGDGAADAEVAVFYFPGTGGSVQANIDRWIGQFTLPDGSPATQAAKVEKQEISGFAVTLVDVAGTFNGGMAPAGGGAGPQPDYRMLGAVIETGDAPWFVKLTGPQQTVAKWKGSFDEFISSIGTR